MWVTPLMIQSTIKAPKVARAAQVAQTAGTVETGPCWVHGALGSGTVEAVAHPPRDSALVRQDSPPAWLPQPSLDALTKALEEAWSPEAIPTERWAPERATMKFHLDHGMLFPPPALQPFERASLQGATMDTAKTDYAAEGISGSSSGEDASAAVKEFAAGGSTPAAGFRQQDAPQQLQLLQQAETGKEVSPAPKVVARLAAQLQQSGVTTLMVRNLPAHVTQKLLIEELDREFAGFYDFCYMPSSFNTKTNKSYAFINFTSSDSVGAFVEAWHGSRRFGKDSAVPGNEFHGCALNVSAATIQGKEAHERKWGQRLRRVRNPEFRPHVVEVESRRPSITSQASSKEESSGEQSCFDPFMELGWMHGPGLAGAIEFPAHPPAVEQQWPEKRDWPELFDRVLKLPCRPPPGLDLGLGQGASVWVGS